MMSKIFKNQATQANSQATQSPELWTEVSTEQQETMKGGYPWPGFPPIGGGGGGFCASNDSTRSARTASSSSL